MLNYYGSLVEIESTDKETYHLPIGSFLIIKSETSENSGVYSHMVRLIGVLHTTIFIDEKTYSNLINLLQYNPNHDCPIVVKTVQ